MGRSTATTAFLQPKIASRQGEPRLFDIYGCYEISVSCEAALDARELLLRLAILRRHLTAHRTTQSMPYKICGTHQSESFAKPSRLCRMELLATEGELFKGPFRTSPG